MPTVITKKSTVVGKVPLSTDLQVGELAVNTADKILYTKHSNNSVIKVGFDTTDIGVTIQAHLGFTPYNSTNPAGYTTNTGTVTSVAALTLGSTGTDVSSSVATSTTTPVITLNIPTASASARGLLSSTDWSTFNGKQAALGFTPYNSTNPAGYTTNTGTVTSASVVNTNGFSGSVATATTTPAITITTTVTGVLKGNGTAISAATAETDYVTPSGTGTLANKTLTAPVINQGINAQIGTTYTVVLGDASNLVTLSNAATITLSVPLNSSVAFPVGTQIDIAQIGAGQVTVAGISGVTVSATPGLKLRAQYSGATLVKTATDTWLMFGDLAA